MYLEEAVRFEYVMLYDGLASRRMENGVQGRIPDFVVLLSCLSTSLIHWPRELARIPCLVFVIRSHAMSCGEKCL